MIYVIDLPRGQMNNFRKELENALSKVPQEDIHIDFKNTFCINNTLDQGSTDHLEYLWSLFSGLQDKNFFEEFIKNPHQRFWEMYVGACAVEMHGRPNVTSENFGPDVKVNLNPGTLWIECVVPEKGEVFIPKKKGGTDKPKINPNSVRNIPLNTADFLKSNNEMLRVTNSISTKINAFRKYLNNGTVAQNDKKIIAISLSDLYGWEKTKRVANSIYPIECDVEIINSDGSHAFGTRPPEPLVKQNENVIIEIPKSYKNGLEVISGVLVFNSRLYHHNTPLENDLCLIHSKDSHCPIDLSTFKNETWVEDVDKNSVSWHSTDGRLIN